MFVIKLNYINKHISNSVQSLEQLNNLVLLLKFTFDTIINEFVCMKIHFENVNVKIIALVKDVAVCVGITFIKLHYSYVMF